MRKIPVPVPAGLDDVLVGSVSGEAGARQAGWVVDRIIELERQKAAIEAAQVRELALLADVYAGTTAEPYVATEVSLALGVSPSVARSRVEVAKSLCGSFTATLAALAAGRIDGFKAKVIVEALTGIEQVGTAQRIEAELLKGVDGRSVTQIRRSLAGLVMRFDPAGAQTSRDAQAAERRVQVTPLGDGIAELWACGPVEGVAAFHTALDALARTARRNPAEDRTLDQLRFDLLGVIGSGILAAGDLTGLAALATGEQTSGRLFGPWSTVSTGQRRGRPVAVNVTVPVDTLAGLAAQPGQIEGYGPVPADVAARIAEDGTWRRIVTDPVTGVLVDYATTAHDPGLVLAGAVQTRDGDCRLPTCTVPATSCDLDHTQPWETGGATEGSNLGALCRHHHRAKQAGFTLRQDSPGVFTWTTPAGKTYSTGPPAIAPPSRRHTATQRLRAAIARDIRPSPDAGGGRRGVP